jgi:hypothetical protein
MPSHHRGTYLSALLAALPILGDEQLAGMAAMSRIVTLPSQTGRGTRDALTAEVARRGLGALVDALTRDVLAHGMAALEAEAAEVAAAAAASGEGVRTAAVAELRRIRRTLVRHRRDWPGYQHTTPAANAARFDAAIAALVSELGEAWVQQVRYAGERFAPRSGPSGGGQTTERVPRDALIRDIEETLKRLGASADKGEGGRDA